MRRMTKRFTLSNWHFMRWVVLEIGIIFTAQAVYLWDLASALLGAFFLFQAITNSGCLACQSCDISPDAKKAGESESHRKDNISFTQVNEH